MGSAGECKSFLSLGLKAAAAVLASHTEVYSSSSLHVRLMMISEDKELYKFNFVEAPSLATLKSVPVNIDRLSGASQLYNSAQSLYEDISEVASNSIDSLRYTKEVLREHVNKSALLYLLQDVLFKHPMCILFACVRATEQSFADNIKVCQLVDNLWNNQYDSSCYPSSQDNDGSDSEEPQESAEFGPREVLSLKELIVALNDEIKTCLTKRDTVEATIKEKLQHKLLPKQPQEQPRTRTPLSVRHQITPLQLHPLQALHSLSSPA